MSKRNTKIWRTIESERGGEKNLKSLKIPSLSECISPAQHPWNMSIRAWKTTLQGWSDLTENSGIFNALDLDTVLIFKKP